MSRLQRGDEAMPQRPTCTGIRVRSVHDAHIIFHGVMHRILPMVTRRLDTDERRMVRPGNVYVWEERGRSAEATGLGIERWTDGIRWSASRVRDEFLLYHERDSGTDLDYPDMDPLSDTPHNNVTNAETRHSLHNRLVKQTYSVFVGTSEGRKKWHLTAYFVPSTVTNLRTVEDMPDLANLSVPDGMYTSAKIGKGRARETATADIHGTGGASPTLVVAPRPYITTVPQQYPAFVAVTNETPLSASSNGSPVVQITGDNSRSVLQWNPNDIQEERLDARIHVAMSRTLPSIVSPGSFSPTSPGAYSPRHPLDNEALRLLNRSV